MATKPKTTPKPARAKRAGGKAKASKAKPKAPEPPKDDGGVAVRVAVVRVVLPQGSLDDHKFDGEKLARDLRKHGQVRLDEIRLATDEERRFGAA